MSAIPPTPPSRPRLASEGQIYVTLAAAEQWLRANTGLSGVEEARRDLTELMLDAYRTEGGHVRYRRKSDGLDVSARVVTEGRLLVVASVMVRDHAGSLGARRR